MLINHVNICFSHPTRVCSYPTETKWTLLSGARILASGQLQLGQVEPFVSTHSLQPGSDYVFIIYDTYGDGLTAGAGR